MKRLFARLAYRTRQFRLATAGGGQEAAQEALAPYLSPPLFELFRQMSASEQAHSMAVLGRLQEAGESDSDLMAAALLHDIGKVRAPLTPIDRTLIVLVRKLVPGGARRWGQGEPRGWNRPFVVAAQHAAWGAEMASQAGASAGTCGLIRRHQDKDSGGDRLLQALQEADDLE